MNVVYHGTLWKTEGSYKLATAIYLYIYEIHGISTYPFTKQIITRIVHSAAWNTMVRVWGPGYRNYRISIPQIGIIS
jgi:hypothetical protein